MPNRRQGTHTSVLNFSKLPSSSASRLLRQHAQPLSSDTHSSELPPRSCFTFGIDPASLISSDQQTAHLSGYLFSQILLPTPVARTVSLPEYFTADNTPPTPNVADYPLRNDEITVYEPQPDPRFTFVTERSINYNDTSSDKRKELEFRRLQSPISS